MLHFTANKIDSSTPSYADIWQRAYNSIIRLCHNKLDTDIIKNSRQFQYKIDENNPLLKDDRTLTSINVREQLTCYGVEFTGVPKKRTILFLLNIGLIVELSIDKIYLLDLFNRPEIYNNKLDVIKSLLQEIIKTADYNKLKNKLAKIFDGLALNSSNIEILDLDLSCDDKFYPVLIKDYQKYLNKSNLDTFKSLDKEIEPFIVDSFKKYFNRNVSITDISHKELEYEIYLAEFYDRNPIDSCAIPCCNGNECVLDIDEYGVLLTTLNEFIYYTTNTELDYQHFNKIYLNASKIEEINIDETLLEHNNIYLILGYANAKKFIDNINAQSLYKATSELEKIDCPNRELTKDEFMAHMEKMYEWYLTSNRCLSKEVNYRYDMIKMKLSELGLDSNFNVV